MSGRSAKGLVVSLAVVALTIAGAVGMRGGKDIARANAPSAPPIPAQINFNRDIRQVLSDRCFSCHGPDATKRQSGLRLDLKASAFEPLPKHTDKRAFVPGKPNESYAYQRMISADPREVMPPPTSHLKVSDAEKELIKRWIEQGAKWQEHWSFVAPVRSEIPAVQALKGQAWPRNEIDHFVLARLEQENLKPSPEADKATLLRRVSLDLTGVPPTLQELDAFIKDESANAYEKVVDRLLASPRYGEQMAAGWLDNARYADSHGFQSDPERFMWHWRDWVINAFNNNMPFDEFTIEQLAGDLLPNATEDQKIATGFNRNHRINSEGGVIDEEWRVETVIDRVETTAGAFLGLTVGCCRCHDHKFDPITQKEFYSLSAYFNSVNERGEAFSLGIDRGRNAEPMIKVFSAEQKEQMAKLRATTQATETTLAALQSRLPEFEAKYKSEGLKAPEPDGLVIHFPFDGNVEGITATGAATRPSKAATQSTTQAAATKPSKQSTTKPLVAKFLGAAAPTFIDGKIGKAIKFDGTGATSVDAGEAFSFDRTDPFSFGAWVNAQAPDGSIFCKMDEGSNFTGIDLFLQGGKIAPHIVKKWPEDAIKVITVNPIPLNAWVHVMVTYDGSSKAAGVKIFVNGAMQQTTTELDNLRKSIKSKSPLLIGKRVESSPFNGSVDDVRIYNRVLTADEVARLGVWPDVEELAKIEPDKRTPEQKARLATALLAPLPEYGAVIMERDTATVGLAAIDADPRNTSMVMEDLPKPRDTFILIRGQYDKHGDKVEPGVPAILPPLPKDAPPNRLGLAKWIVDPANPLTARVQVNRLWEKFFGVGIVKTSEDFGTQAQWPSHPELLDWLATEFVRLKWDLKALQKEIVMSATYRQSSNVTPDLLERDPENRLFARSRRLRLSAEIIRDQALATSGLLVEQIGGPSVKPYEPENIWDGNIAGNLAKYELSTGGDLYRRSLYTFLKRTAAPPNLMVFDMPSREYCIVKRSRTNTPLQALDLMNDPTYVEAARAFAQQMMTSGGSTAPDRLAYAFRRATCRQPTDAEARILANELNNQLERYTKDPDAAKKLISVGASPRDEKLNASELAAYTMVGSVILNLDEMVTKP